MRTDDTNKTASSRILRGVKRYFGFDQPELTPRQRWRIFLGNEQRSFDRLLGRAGGSSCCGRPTPDIGSTQRRSGRGAPTQL